MKTTVLIEKTTSERLSEHANVLGKSISGMAELVIRKGLDFVDANGYDEFIKIPSKATGCTGDTSNSTEKA